ncbi:MAG: hypothetical protein AAF269_11535 [Pseudomonadota bacterium]
MLVTHKKFAFLVLLGAAMLAGPQQAQEAPPADEPTSSVLVIHDWSNSMWGAFADGTRKYEAGVTALTNALDTGFGGRHVGYRAYGHRQPGDCRDSELVSDFDALDVVRPEIVDTLGKVRPTGKTPITYSLQEGLKDFKGGSGDILLISDGIETCDADPCELMREWKASKVNIRVHVVGVGLNELERTAMACIAEESGGTYLDAESSDGFDQALGQVADTIETASAPTPVDSAELHAIIIRAHDANDRDYRIGGEIRLNGEKVGDATSIGHGRNVVDGPGEYELHIGPLLRDGSVYRPVVQSVTVDAEGETRVDVLVEAPARVTAKFVEDGEPHPGANVSAWQDGEEVFTFRAKDEALAAPGDYEFRAEPNADNKLVLRETLIEDTDTELVFELNKTVRFMILYRLPNGETFKRNGELWQDGEKVYSTYSRFSGARPGVYQHHSDDQNLPIEGVEIEISEDEQVIEVPVEAGFITIAFENTLENYAREKLPTRALLVSLDRGNSDYSTPGRPIAVKPGRYAVEGFGNDGFFDRPEVEIANGESLEVTLTPKPLGELVMTYAESENYLRTPDRGSAYALDGQRIIGGILRPGVVRKFLPGNYRIEGYSYAGDIEAQDVEVVAGERTEVVLRLRGE